MKRFISFLLCVILPFMFLCPLSSKALDIQGTEYPTPSFLPIDVDFSEYDYYFVCVTGKPESPSYRFYFFKDTNNSGHLYVSVFLSSFSTSFHSGEFTSFGVTTNYGTSCFSYSSSGTWSTLSSTSSRLADFTFDGYSEFSSSSKYIIGCNTDIYDYSGNLVRKGDYNNLTGYFLGGLNGSSDKSEKPTEPTTSGGSGSGNSVGLNPVDLDFFSNSFSDILNSLDAIATAFESITISISTEIIEDTLEEIKTGVNNVSFVISENFNEFTETFSQKISLLQSDLFDFKKAFLEFASVDGEIKKLAQLFSSINQSISLLKTGLTDTIEQITDDFNDFADDVKSNVSSIRMIVNDFTDKFDTIISKLNNILKSLNDIDFKAEFNSISTSFNIGFAGIIASIDGISTKIGDIKISLGDIKNSVSSDFSTLIDAVNSGFSTVNSNLLSLPEKFSELLKYLFIPKEDHFTELMDEINEHFGFVHQIIELGNALVDDAEFDKTEPSYTLNFDSDTYGHFNADIVDFSLVEPYVSFVKALISGIVVCLSIRRWRKRLPDIINGTGGD